MWFYVWTYKFFSANSHIFSTFYQVHIVISVDVFQLNKTLVIKWTYLHIINKIMIVKFLKSLYYTNVTYTLPDEISKN